MPNALSALALLICGSLYSIIWGRLLWFLSEKSALSRVLAFRAMSLTRISFPIAYSVVLSSIYALFGTLGTLGLALACHLGIEGLFAFQAGFIPLICLGIMAELSLSHFLVGIYLNAPHRIGVDASEEIRNVPWIIGVSALPAPLKYLFVATAAFLEELFFRGVFFLILIRKLLVPTWFALGSVTMLFLLQQLLQVRTTGQAVIIGCSCFAISTVGCLLVVCTGSVIPAIICHVSFGLFYLCYKRTGD